MSDDDVIIIGTGAGGGTLAHRLAPSGKRILVLDAPATEAVAGRVEGQEVMRRPVVGDVRTSSSGENARPFGLSKPLATTAVSPVRGSWR